jgi:hypothetical protein
VHNTFAIYLALAGMEDYCKSSYAATGCGFAAVPARQLAGGGVNHSAPRCCSGIWPRIGSGSSICVALCWKGSSNYSEVNDLCLITGQDLSSWEFKLTWRWPQASLGGCLSCHWDVTGHLSIPASGAPGCLSAPLTIVGVSSCAPGSPLDAPFRSQDFLLRG